MEINRPTLLLNKDIAIHNLENMLAKTKRNQLLFRPHFKTHQSIHLGELFRERGVKSITVSSVHMAEYFAAGGWDDITIAFPANVLRHEAINRLAEKIKLNLLVVNVETVKILTGRLTQQVGIFIKIDVGSHRTGVSPKDIGSIDEIIETIRASPHLKFQGFLAHAGHSYGAKSKNEILEIHESSCYILRALKNKYSSKYPAAVLSTGDTPTCSVAEKWDGIDEFRPGNFIFYDLMQTQIGSCRLEDIAVCLACPIVAKHADRQELIVHGGGIHLSKDRLHVGKKGLGLNLEEKTIFGVPVQLNENGWEMPKPGNFVRSLSQEHGVISCSDDFFKRINIGDLIGILPVHSCMTVDLMPEMLTVNGEKIGVIH